MIRLGARALSWFIIWTKTLFHFFLVHIAKKCEHFVSLWSHLSFICMTRVPQIWIFVKFLTRQMWKAHIDLSIKIPLGRGEEVVPYWLVKPEPGWRGEELGRAIVRGWLRVCAWNGCQLVLGFAPASITIPWILGPQCCVPLEYLDHGTLWPEFISFCSWRGEGRGDEDSGSSHLKMMRTGIWRKG